MEELIDALARYDSPTLANAVETFEVRSRDVGFADSRVTATADRGIEREWALLRWVRSDQFDPDRLSEMRARH
jgi:hypothetical protein